LSRLLAPNIWCAGVASAPVPLVSFIFVLQHGGFKPLAAAVNASDATPAERNVRLLWGVGLLSFFLSAALDNLTTTIVMLSVLQVGCGAS
jgi:Na+/H+ antiporter NhaD/arsenite permease-like protein